MSMRLQRVEQVLRRALAEILLRGELRDPRLREIAAVSITGVKISPDLAHAQIYVDVLAGTVGLHDVLAGLNAGASLLRSRVAGRIRLKRTPMLHFVVDTSIEQGLKIESVLAELRSEGSLPPPAAVAPTATDDDGHDDDADPAE